MKNITLTIDGQEVTIEENKTVLEAAKKANIYIPTLCTHKYLSPYGACRLCIVEIEGIKGFLTACTIPVSPEMIVKTNTEKIQQLRKTILELILTTHPNACLFCEKKKECEKYQECIQKSSVTTGCKFCPKNDSCELQKVTDYVGLERLRFSTQFREFSVERDDPFFDRNYNLCILCGRCVRVCEEVRGASIIGFVNRGVQTIVGTGFGRNHLDANCQFCGACIDVCPTGALSERFSKWQGIPDCSVVTTCPHCSVGCQISLNVKNGRVISSTPADNQICLKGRFAVAPLVYHPKRVTSPCLKKNDRILEVSWNEALDFIAENFLKYKGDNFAAIVSPNLTNEDAYIAQKFTREVMESENIDSSLRLTFSANAAVGLDSLNPDLSEIGEAGCILVVGSDIPYSHPIVTLEIKKAVKNGAELVVVDPRQTSLASLASLWLKINPGTDLALLFATAQIILEEKQKTKLRQIEEITNIPQEQIQHLISILTSVKPLIIIYGTGITQQAQSTKTLQALLSLAFAADAQVFPLWGQTNARGLNEVGCLGKGLSYFEILEAIEKGKIRCLYSIGESFISEKVKPEFWVVQDLFFPENLLPDVFLPAASFAEIDGTYNNLEGKTKEVKKVIEPVENSKPDWWILCKIAKRLGAKEFEYEHISQITTEIQRKASLKKKVKMLTMLNIFTSDYGEIKKMSDRKYPFLLITEYNFFKFRNTLLSERIKGIRRLRDEETIRMNPQDADTLKISPGDEIKLISPYGETTGRVKFSEKISPGQLFIILTPGSLNLVSKLLDPISKTPSLKHCGVRIEKL
ncbi:MAG: molybdopterin-dependent oxidoreductase [Candidatus Edwardsbacteria bacterium]